MLDRPAGTTIGQRHRDVEQLEQRMDAVQMQQVSPTKFEGRTLCVGGSVIDRRADILGTSGP